MIHYCIGVLPTDMDEALERVRRAFAQVCDGDPLSKLSDGLGMPPESLKRLSQSDSMLLEALNAEYMFN